MANQYKPTKQKKEKPAKAPKAPKAEKTVKLGSAMLVKTNKPAKAPKPPKTPKVSKPEKPAKIGSAMKVKTNKPVKEPKQPKVPKPEKVTNTPIKVGKVEKAEKLEKTNVNKKPLNRKVIIAIAVAAVVVLVLLFTVVIPALIKHGQKIKEITIDQMPEKTVYLQGEEPNYDGLRVKVTRNNGESFIVRASECQIKGFNTDIEIDKLTVTITYKGSSCGFAIKVLKHDKPTPVLKSIYLDPIPKTEYKVGDYLDVSRSSIIRVYMDGTTESINLRRTDIHGWEKVSGPGEYTLTVKYAENGVLCTFDYKITVTP